MTADELKKAKYIYYKIKEYQAALDHEDMVAQKNEHTIYGDEVAALLKRQHQERVDLFMLLKAKKEAEFAAL